MHLERRGKYDQSAAGVPLGASPANARATAVTATGTTKELDTDVTASLDVSDELDRTINELVKQVNVELNTYLFEPGTFTSLAKFTPTRQSSVVSDHLGTPAALYDGAGELVWQNRMDIYGRPLWTDGLAADMWFRYPSQYEDNETGLSYNRFRYYDVGVGCYISRDPIGLAAGNPTLYGYVGDVNGSLDPFGLWEHLFRGTTEGYPGNASLQRIGITPASTDPRVATIFGVEAGKNGTGVLHIASKTDLTDVDILEGNVLAGIEREVPVGVKPSKFADLAQTSISIADSRRILGEMGYEIPSNVTKSYMSDILRNLKPMSDADINTFVNKANGCGK